MTIVTKICVRCKQTKGLPEFYVRSGCQNPTEPGHYLSECKACIRERGKLTNNIHPLIPRAKTEILALEALKRAGVGAVPGKAVHAADVDVVAWGHVWIEVKYARLEFKRGEEKFTFTSTPKQMQRGYLAQVVMLICDWGDERYTYHLFRADDPVFYMKGRIKAGFDFTPGLMAARKHGNNRVVMIQPMMDAAQDRWELIESTRRHIAEQIRMSVM